MSLVHYGILRCPYCGKFFADKIALVNHLNLCHQPGRWVPRVVGCEEVKK